MQVSEDPESSDWSNETSSSTVRVQLMRMENDVLATAEMAGAVHMLLEGAVRSGLSAEEARACLRCATHLKGYADDLERGWREAMASPPG